MKAAAIANARIAPMPCSFAARMAAEYGHVFLHLHVHLNKGFALFN